MSGVLLMASPRVVGAQPGTGRRTAAAPDSVPVAPGQRVRFRAAAPAGANAWRVGVVARVSRDSLWLAPAAPGGGGAPVALADLRVLDVGRGDRGSQTRHVLVAAGTGFVAGALGGVIATPRCSPAECNSSVQTGFSAARGALLGLVLGAVAGGVWPSGPRWQRVLPRPRAA